MGFGSYNYVCFSCRKAYRRMAWGGGSATCASCQQPCKCIGFRWRVPTKNDDKGWKELTDKFSK